MDVNPGRIKPGQKGLKMSMNIWENVLEWWLCEVSKPTSLILQIFSEVALSNILLIIEIRCFPWLFIFSFLSYVEVELTHWNYYTFISLSYIIIILTLKKSKTLSAKDYLVLWHVLISLSVSYVPFLNTKT